MTTSELATVLAWHDALNAADVDTLVALSSDDIEVGDAHGAAQGHAALREAQTNPPPPRRRLSAWSTIM
jgi:ketosteroid isomerase-like protein